mmetsp:Transcript_43328/g.133829  ORF Transcript_43328/g.133829 Transcript_43328/m.133829 type:complete len:239 (+) Transcript_43328:183-899(+)
MSRVGPRWIRWRCAQSLRCSSRLLRRRCVLTSMQCLRRFARPCGMLLPRRTRRLRTLNVPLCVRHACTPPEAALPSSTRPWMSFVAKQIQPHSRCSSRSTSSALWFTPLPPIALRRNGRDLPAKSSSTRRSRAPARFSGAAPSSRPSRGRCSSRCCASSTPRRAWRRLSASRRWRSPSSRRSTSRRPWCSSRRSSTSCSRPTPRRRLCGTSGGSRSSGPSWPRACARAARASPASAAR